MNGFVRQIQKERLVTVTLLFQEVDGVTGQERGDVAVLGHPPAVDIDCVVRMRRVVVPLAAEAHPIIKSGSRIVMVPTHVPFPNETRRITSILKILREEAGALRHQPIVVDDTMTEGVLASEN